jgi:hypothetical protein
VWKRRAAVAVFAVIGGALVAVVVVFVIRPPALAWLGFAILSIIVLGLAALAPIAFERTRISPLLPARAKDVQQRLLVIADAHCDPSALCDAIVARLDGVSVVYVVVPVRVSHLHFLTDDESQERREAKQTMLESVELLRLRGVFSIGSVGSDKPLESMTDALGSFPATRVLLATPPAEETYWLERDLLAKARALTAHPVTQAFVPSLLARPARRADRG